ncbi:MAG: hypothetical protein HQ474_10660 [Flammeovirgaceae bacterium]|jgi:hypothetical protein|nr:hypothetical protein [Flammeovirgaceae bacterium]|tara:strand:- start:13059 stop:13574 length:516 start_codon:yes stop_codon:yes gene_type:complete
MEMFIDLLKILGPASLVLYASYLMVRSLLKSRFDELMLEVKQRNKSISMPIRLQAYERIVLLLERTSPSNLIPRVNKKEMEATVLQHILVKEIRQEFNHNLAQQIYISQEAWSYVKAAIEDTITLINEAAMGLNDDDSSLELAKKVLESSIKSDSINNAISFMKEEIKDLF